MMNTTITPKRKLQGDHSDFALRLPTTHRNQMQAIAEHRGWSEAEAVRRAIAFFLDQNRDLVQVLCPDLVRGERGHE